MVGYMLRTFLSGRKLTMKMKKIREWNVGKQKYGIALVAFMIAPTALGYWGVRQNTPTLAQVEVDFPLGNPPKSGVLMLKFNQHASCSPEVSFTLIKTSAQILGKPENYEWMDSQMAIWVDGDLVWQEKTVGVKYPNAVQTMGQASKQVIFALSNGKEAVVRMKPGTPKFVMTLQGAGKSIELARKNCASIR